MRRHSLPTVPSGTDLAAARWWFITGGALLLGAVPAAVPLLAFAVQAGLGTATAVLAAVCGMSTMLTAAFLCHNTGLRRLRYDRPDAIESHYGYRHAPSSDGDAR
jgi:VIT1/CCC1 family predicted Fe2+/Mn2+ transporter